MDEEKTKRLKLIKLVNIIPAHENLSKGQKIRTIFFNLIFWWGVFSLLWHVIKLIIK